MDHTNDLPSEGALKNLTPPALRASVFLTANQKLETIWPDDSARHATSLIGVWLWLKFVFDDLSVKDEKDSAALSAIRSAARSADSAACADYDDLLQKTTHGSTSLWPAIPLWQGFNAKQIQQLQQHFFTELKALSLDFLESDVRYLWDLKGGIAPSRARLDRFVQLFKLSDAEWKKTYAAAIKKLLAGDETLSTFNAVRVILIGPGGAGKTALNHLLHYNEPIEQPTASRLRRSPSADAKR